MKNILLWGKHPYELANFAYGLAHTFAPKGDIGVIDLHHLPKVGHEKVTGNGKYFHIPAPYTPSKVLSHFDQLLNDSTISAIVIDGLCQVWGGEGGVKTIATVSRAGWQDPSGEPMWSKLLMATAYAQKPVIVTATAKVEATVVNGAAVYVAMFPEVQPKTEHRFTASFLVEGSVGRLQVQNVDLGGLVLGSELHLTENMDTWKAALETAWAIAEAHMEVVYTPNVYGDGQMLGHNPKERDFFAEHVKVEGKVPDSRDALSAWAKGRTANVKL